MELIFKGSEADIEKFINEIIYPVIYQRQYETEGHYFRITEDNKKYLSRQGRYNHVRRMRGYFPGKYYDIDFYEGKYDPQKDFIVNEDGLIEIKADAGSDKESAPDDVK